MQFRKWIKEVGPEKVASLLGVNVRTVYFWLEKKATPTITTMQRIVLITRGRVTFDRIISETKKKKV